MTISGGSGGRGLGGYSSLNAEVSPPPNSPTEMYDAPYIKRLNAYDIDK